MKSTTNVFLEGLRTDLHPLSTGQQYLTDALNATMITYNGNEMMLQNDMGNTRILDSATGNIMSLSPGFIPVGMKEHGGIMYIASVNKDGLGEIGTVPSPIIRDVYKDKISIPFYDTIIPVDTGDPIQITNKLYPADKFIANLQMTIDPNSLKGILHTKKSGLSVQKGDPCDIVLERLICNTITPNGKVRYTSLYSPVISYSTNSEDNVYIDELEYPRFVRKKGIYKLNLYSSPEESKSVMTSESFLSSQVYGPNGGNKSLYWFLHTGSPTTVFPKDLFNATLNKDLKQVPVSNKPGKLAIELIPESITDFGMLPRKDSLYVPITYKTNDAKYHTYFPGFYYTSDSGLYVEKLTARVIDESTNLEVDLVYPYELGKEVLFDRFDLADITYESSKDDEYENPFCNGGLKLWNITDELGLPHLRSSIESNTQILSPIVGLFNHTQTPFKSSTQDKDDSPHSGVFYADLGGKYQNWYRLEVDYEDLYGGNKGTFTTRFNPYINDVFGTNLSITSIYIPEYFQLGSEVVIHQLSYTTIINPSQHLSPLLSGYVVAKVDSLSKKPGVADWHNDLLGAYYISNDANATMPENMVCDKEGIITCSLDFDVQNIWSLDFLYLYDDYNLTLSLIEGNMTVTQKDLQASVLFDSIFPHNKLYGLYILSKDTVEYWDGNILSGNQVTSPQFNLIGYDDWYPYTKHGFLFAPSSGFRFSYSDSASGSGNNMLPFPHALAGTSVNDEEWFGVFDVPSDVTNASIKLRGLKKYYGYFNVFENADLESDGTYKGLFCTTSLSENDYCSYSVTVTATLEVSCKTPEVILRPKYCIAPYFLLQGIDGGKTGPVYRFGSDGGTELVYKHNFEGSESGIATNYIQNESLGMSQTSTILQCSYTHEHPFYYYSDPVNINLQLDSGIYVLNITRVPGHAFNEGVTLTVQVLDFTRTFYPNQWVEQPEFVESKDSFTVDGNYYTIFRPIVLILDTPTIITITTNGSDLIRQNIGLYKLANVDTNKIVELRSNIQYFLDAVIVPYDEYMFELDHGVSISDKSKRYAFIQAYGVFFKEAYVFIDGVKDRTLLYSISIMGNTYKPYPYIPSDPSILPARVTREEEWIWNTYMMPTLVIDGRTCDFEFSNPLDTNYSTDPEPGNLRNLIEYEN